LKQNYAQAVGAIGVGAQGGGAVARWQARGANAREERDNGRVLEY